MYLDNAPDEHDELVRAVLGQLSTDFSPDAEDDTGHALDQSAVAVALAAQNLAFAIDASHPGLRPNGWRDANALVAALAEARELALTCKYLLDQQPTKLSAYGADLGNDRLPTWAGGESETWIREEA